VTARCEFFNGKIQDMPIDFAIPLNGDAVTQAKAAIDSLDSDVHDGQHPMMGNCVSASADNAGGAKAESTHLDLEKEIMAMVPKLEAQQQVWDKLSAEQKVVLRKFNKRHCTGHQLQLISDFGCATQQRGGDARVLYGGLCSRECDSARVLWVHVS
jgi:hypothetical protein